MANYGSLDGVFAALSDPTRRAVVERLAHGPVSVSALAEPFSMKLPSFLKHVRALEDCGLIQTSKKGRTRLCTLQRTHLDQVGDWLEIQRREWEERTDRLERYVTEDSSLAQE